MSRKKSMISAAVGSAFAATLGAAPVVSAADNPFALQPVDKSYQLAYADRVDASKYGGAKAAGEGRCGWAMADTNGDNKVSREEYDKHNDIMFKMMDTNKDGFVDMEEANRARAGKPAAAGANPHGK